MRLGGTAGWRRYPRRDSLGRTDASIHVAFSRLVTGPMGGSPPLDRRAARRLNGELPRACFRAGEIAHFAEFFSFGTNDLTQTASPAAQAAIEGRH
jgi:hypothetical protein